MVCFCASCVGDRRSKTKVSLHGMVAEWGNVRWSSKWRYKRIVFLPGRVCLSRCAKILWITADSVIQAIILTFVFSQDSQNSRRSPDDVNIEELEVDLSTFMEIDFVGRLFTTNHSCLKGWGIALILPILQRTYC